MGESLEVASCGYSCSWGAEGPLGGLSHEAPLGSQRPWWSRGGPPSTKLPRPRNPSDSAQQLVLEAPRRPASTPLFVSVSSFFTNNCVRRAAPDLGSLAPIHRPSLGAGLVSPAQPWSPHMVPITVPLSPVSALAAWAHARGEGLPPHPPCPRWMLRYGPQISAQPFVTTGQSLLPPELLAAGLISDLHRAGARAPGLSLGGHGARPGGLPQARLHSWPPLAHPRQPNGQTPEVQSHPCWPPALSLGNASMKDPRPPTGAVGWVSIYFLLPGLGCHCLQEERDAWWVLQPRPQQPHCGLHSRGIQMRALKAQKTGLWGWGGRCLLGGQLADGVAGMGCPPSVGGCSRLSGPGVSPSGAGSAWAPLTEVP